MKKIAKFPKPNQPETLVHRNVDLTDQIRADTVNDLESLTEDFKHMTLVVESIQHNYQALLAQNRLLTETLLSLVNECYCWQGNRCDRCQRILKVVSGQKPEQKQNPNAVQEYKAILKQLRKLG